MSSFPKCNIELLDSLHIQLLLSHKEILKQNNFIILGQAAARIGDFIFVVIVYVNIEKIATDNYVVPKGVKHMIEDVKNIHKSYSNFLVFD